MTKKVSQLLKLRDRYSIHLIPVHLPGSRIVLSDSLSRRFMTQPGEWTLNRQILRSGFDFWGFPSLDLFATAANRRLHLFVSPYPDGQALGFDALTLDYSSGTWCIPPLQHRCSPQSWTSSGRPEAPR